MSDPLSPFQLSVEGVRQLVESGKNKSPAGGPSNSEGVVSEKYDAYKVKMSDEELLKLRDDFEKRYAPYESKLKPRVKRIRESYIGNTASGQWIDDPDAIVPANEQFMAMETYLPASLAKNPEPVVYADNTEEGNALSSMVKTMLTFHADQLVLRRKLSFMVRQHATDLLGVLKPGWNKMLDPITGEDRGDVEIANRKVKDYIFDPNGYVDVYGDFSSWYGERITVTAEKLIEEFPDHKAYISTVVEGKLGTEVEYTEWWPSDEFCFYTFKDVVLDKFKNPYYKYPEPVIDELTGEPVLDPITGEPQMTQPRNHFARPKKPGIFLSIYSLQEQPHDITSLVEQNMPNQRRITKMTTQIDYNASAMNNTYALSEANFNQETGKQFVNARKKGNPILVPEGVPLEQAVKELPAQEVPQGLFAELQNAKDDLRTSWGINGITASPQDEDQTARGMILNQAHDTSRIGGGIGDSIEQVADNVFNWLLQLYYVFYDEPHFAAIMGNAKAVEFITLTNQDLDRQIIVSVAPDSLKPKDEITQINLAQALFDKGAIGPKTLLKMLDFPDPDNSAADGVLYKMDPMAYMMLNFPDFAAQLQQAQQQQAMTDMQNQAQATGMQEAAKMGMAPEQTTEPEEGLARDPASAALSEVQLPPL